MKEQGELFCDYFDEWIKQNKEGTVRDITLIKWNMASTWVRKLAPDLTLEELDRREYQILINKYAETHEKVTTEGFHHMLKASILDAVDEDIIVRNPTRKVVIKGKKSKEKT